MSAILMNSFGAAGAAETLSLAGPWRFELDRQDAGVAQRWFARDLNGTVVLPGGLTEQGIGDEVTVDTKWMGSLFDTSYFTAPEFAPYRQPGNIKVPFWLQPEKYYAGAAWYQRDIEIPTGWRERNVALLLERPHWKTTVWLDDRELGSNDSLSVPHEYALGSGLAAGRHRLSIRVDNSLVVDIGVNSHSITDHSQGNWNGLVGRIELLATARAWIADLQVYPHAACRSVTVKGRVGGNGRLLPKGTAVDLAADGGRPVAAMLADDGSFEAEYVLGADAPLWDEFHPALHRLDATLQGGESRSVVFGLREIATQGTQFVLNGRPVFFRGTLECCIFPGTGHPPTDVGSWKRIIGVAKSYGLNLFRFHSWCPPEAAFVAGDELGFYFQVEAASWPFQATMLGDGQPVDGWLEAETDRILSAYGNHPSFLLMAACNEPGGPNHEPYLASWVARHKAADPRRLFTSASGWPQLAENQFHITSDPRIQHWEEGLRSRINVRPPETQTDYREYIAARRVPVVSHEIGQWCAYPDFAEMPEYTGYLKPRNFEIFRDTLRAHHLESQAHDFLMASGNLQTLCYKEEIESVLRTPGMGGFELLDLHDFPGQGTALVGVLNPFWKSKGYVSEEHYRRFCSATVPLARLAKRVFTTDESLDVDMEVSHFGPAPLHDVVPVWRLVGDDGRVLANGRLPARDIPFGSATALGRVAIALKTMPAPARFKLVLGLEGTGFENDWDVWVYRSAVDTTVPSGISVVHDLTADAIATLNTGGRVLLLVPPDRVQNAARKPVVLGFSSIFWNTAWTNRQPPTTLGVLCDPRHAALAEFPTDPFSNWQWWYAVTRAGAMILDDLPVELHPIVQVIDDWTTSRRLGLVIEARVGRGRLLVCSIDLSRDDNPVTRQLYAGLLHYAAGPRFEPPVELSPAQVRGLMTIAAVAE